MRLMITLAVLLLTTPLLAQTADPVYRLAFIPGEPVAAGAVQPGVFRVSVQPPEETFAQQSTDPVVAAELSLQGSRYDGRWLFAATDNDTLAEEERFVLEKFRLFQNADSAEQFRPWLDEETFAAFARSVRSGEIDLLSDREQYRQYDAIRLLGSIRYGVYTLLYTQFRAADTGEPVTSVMPVRRVEYRLVTAGGLHGNSHELYRMLAFGTLQRQLTAFLAQRINP